MASNALAVLLVFALLGGALWLARRKGLATLAWRLPRAQAGAAPRARLQVLERIPLTSQHSLHLVSCAGRLLVVGVSPGGCSALANLEATETAERAEGFAGGGVR